MTAPVLVPADWFDAATAGSDDLTHIASCANPDVTYCGVDVEDVTETASTDLVCVVCADLLRQHREQRVCPTCST